MKTILTKSPRVAAEFIRNGGLTAFPTETVYGLGANIFDETAIAKIFQAKMRPADNPLIAHVGDLSQIADLTTDISSVAQDLIAAFFPAPLTVVLPKSAKVPLLATANLETIGVRMPQHDLALEFLRECKTPVVAPSANLSGKPSPTTWHAVFEDLDNRIDCILQADSTRVGLESTVVDCTNATPIILRAGAITLEQLRKIAPQIIIAQPNSTLAARSPGTRHKHYSPNAKVVLIKDFDEIKDAENAAFIGLRQPPHSFEQQRLCADVTDYARNLFDFFRYCDAHNIKIIYCETVAPIDLGLALMDRLERSSRQK